jgi:hypothetical protein
VGNGHEVAVILGERSWKILHWNTDNPRLMTVLVKEFLTLQLCESNGFPVETISHILSFDSFLG